MPRFLESSVDAPLARELLGEYVAFRAADFPGPEPYRPASPDAAAFTRPSGVFLVAVDEETGAALGCGGVRLLDPDRAELKHIWLRSAARGRGLGHELLGRLEVLAAELGAVECVLDTHSSLTAAGALYRSRGYRPIAPYNDNPNATTWLGLRIADR